MKEETISNLDYIFASAKLVGSLSALLDMLMSDVDKGEKISTSYYRNRVEQLREEYPYLMPSKRYNNH